MLGNNKLLQGLFFGVVGCIVAPIVSPSLLAGGGIKLTKDAPSIVTEKAQAVTTKRDTFLRLLLAGYDSEKGLVVELSRGKEENSQWKLGKVTWLGKEWGKNWLLYYDNIHGEYSFIDKVSGRSGNCLGYTVHWGNNKVCYVKSMTSEDKAKWKNSFPKIKFDGWSSILPGNGYSSQAILPSLINCSVNVLETKNDGKDNLVSVISCKSGSLVRAINTSDLEKLILSRS